jgi:hypothetical protein
VISLRALFLENPELRRNLRIELSSKRLFTAGIITAVFALIVLPSLLTGTRSGINAPGFGSVSFYLMAILWSQRITLALGGAISCWRAVRREREMNTYDYQRITRLSPLELTVGKLFGAPALAYFVTLCLALPALLSAATTSGDAIALLLRSYLLLFTGSLVIHSFALMISTVSDRGGAASGVVLLLLLQVFPAIGWLIVISERNSTPNVGQVGAIRFYGILFPPTLLWAGLELAFASWLLLAVIRNIKVGLEVMQLFTVRQGLGFAAFCNFVWMGFHPWRTGSNISSAGALLILGVISFYAVGIGVLRSREVVRRGLREATEAFSQSVRLLGPIGSFALAAVLTQILILILAQPYSPSQSGTRAPQDLFMVLYFAAWVARDLFYLQWMKVRPVPSSLRKAFLYLAVFYISTSIVFRSTLASTNTNAAFAAWFVPFPFLRTWMEQQWDAASGMVLMALLVQLAAAAAFAYLYLQQVEGLGNRPQVVPLARSG